MNRVFTGRWSWLAALAVAYTVLALFLLTVGPEVSKEVVDIARVAVFAIILATFAPIGIYILIGGLTAPKWHGLLGTFALGAAVFVQGTTIFGRRLIRTSNAEIPGWLEWVAPALRGLQTITFSTYWDVFLAFNFVLAGFLFLSGPHLADPTLPRRTFRWVLVGVGTVCAVCGILIGRYLAPA